MTPDIRVHADDFDPVTEAARLESGGAGGVATFTGIVRGENGLVALELEHYPAMSERALAGIADRAAKRWTLTALTIVHRVGRLGPGARIVFVGAASKHRADAIEAMHFVIDWLKTDAPFWKREQFGDGRSQWVELRDTDVAAKDRWES
ncbi:molybdenum cofactor biosynthesis protein MoaE [Parasphingopyxis sp.]|uniref:molybdenum cofactor biosynthesis protein MoaE n=1 Tax=Parasphingopyxis sp. TaxID=1920299 RepID=UPI00262393DD|nr:molybdenum cofactor biosynthesis protein MoaE [Parasphingopyxis sp.]